MATLLTNIIGPSNVLISSDIGSTVQAYDSNLTSFVNTFNLPTTDSTNGYALTTNGSGTLSFSAVAGGSFNISDDTSTTSAISSGETLKIVGTNGITSTISGDTVTIDGSSISVDLTNVNSNIVPDTDETYNLGSLTSSFKDFFYAGDIKQQVDIFTNSVGLGSPVTQFAFRANTEKKIFVNVFTSSGGLSTPALSNTTFNDNNPAYRF
jgi:hypothetical protein